MKKIVTLIVRILFGLAFAISGLNGLFQFFEIPVPEGKGGEFLGALVGTGYFFQFLKITETVCGLLLIAGFFVPLALIVLAPIVLNIFLFHVFADPAGIVPAIVLLVFELYLAWAYFGHFKGVLVPTAEVG